MTVITPGTSKIGKNDEMTAITPLGPKIAQCYSGPPLYKEGNRYTEETFLENEKKICF